MTEETKPLVKMRGIHKRFGGVTALEDVDLDACSGEVLAIVGDNGAGKSTLIKILTGVYQQTSGTMELLQALGRIPQFASRGIFDFAAEQIEFKSQDFAAPVIGSVAGLEDR